MGLYQFTFRFLLLATLLGTAGCLTSDQANDATKAIVTNEPSAISNLGNPNNSGNNISGNGITVSANGLQQATLVAGNAISCVKDLNAYFFCWGKGLGNVPVVTAWSNPQISEVKISQNGGHSCFKKVDNTLYCFGQNDFGQSGVNYTQSLEVQTPHLMTQLQNQSQPIVDFAVGFRHTCFIQNTLIDGVWYQALQCLGDNTFGQLSKSIDLNSVDYVLKTFQPLNVMVLSGQDLVTQVPLAASKVTAGQNHTCAIDSVSGYVYCWGYGGTIGNGNTLTTSTPTLLSFSNAPSTIGYKTMTAISAGANHTCSINSLGNLLCWGKNAYAQVSGSLTNTTDKLSAMKINPANNSMQVVAVSAGKNHTCAIVKNNLNQFTNDLWCWGANDKYQVIDPAVGGAACNGSFCGFVKVLSTGVTSVTSGDSHTCAVQDGDLKCWGKDDFGQSGVATIAPPTVSEPRVLTPQTIIFGI